MSGVDEGVKGTDLANDETITVRLVVEEISRVAPLAVLLEESRDCLNSFVLGDFGGGEPGRFSYFGLEPVEVLEFSGGDLGDPFDLLQAACDKYRLEGGNDLPVPFVGGWVGYLSYDLGRYVEQLPDEVEHDIDMPLMRFGFFDALLGWDGQLGRGYLLALDYEGQKESAWSRIDRLWGICSADGGAGSVAGGQDDKCVDETSEIIRQMECNISREDYLAKVGCAVEYIKAGDIFEVNLSQRFSCGYGSDAAVLYEYLTRHNPAGYSALLRDGEAAVVSASPELFLSLRGREIITR
ncbi:MAG: chorismate-binding protein, partial [Sedimentisphaerales bacterium]|nr:chorismate-binding protein [Sedimentisphaerales bacterium]